MCFSCEKQGTKKIRNERRCESIHLPSTYFTYVAFIYTNIGGMFSPPTKRALHTNVVTATLCHTVLTKRHIIKYMCISNPSSSWENREHSQYTVHSQCVPYIVIHIDAKQTSDPQSNADELKREEIPSRKSEVLKGERWKCHMYYIVLGSWDEFVCLIMLSS